ncbi:MAG TPA: hypothetical protein VFO23_04420 [Steroidobacteraceae bacterium]|nr:hypothetical protein [Steroidobacteraceae bacterium]
MRGRAEDRLDSWKKIASYLKRDVSTVQRWERREGMPVHRHLHDRLGSVFAFRTELDAWWEGRRKLLATEEAEERTRAEPPGAAAPAAPGPGSRFRHRVALALLAAVLALGALAWFAAPAGLFWRNPLADARFIRLGDFAGTQQAAAISRDGRFVAFLAAADGQTDAWLSPVGSGTYRNLTHGTVPELVNPSIRTLGFSADSTLVSVWTRHADGSQPGDVNILAMPTAGGALQPYLRDAAEFDWSHDGARMVYHTTAPGDPLFVRPRAGGPGADRRVYVAPAGVHCHFPIWSPDDAFIYFVRGVPPDDWDVWRIRPSGAGLERITAHNSRVAYPVMLAAHTLLYLATDADGSGPWLYALDVERRVPHRISAGLESYTSLGASGDGARLVATMARPRTSLWRMVMPADGAAAPAAVPTAVLASGSRPRLGPDFLVFVAAAGERQGIWTLRGDVRREIWGSVRARIVGAPAIAPDGRRIAFSAEDEGRTRLYVVDSDGAHARVLSDALLLRGSPAWAPDGQSVVAAAVRGGEPRLMRVFLNGDPPAQLVGEYSLDPAWSPHGEFVVYSGADVGTTFPLRAAASDGRPYPMPGVMLTRGARRVAFLKNRQALVLLRGDIGHKNLWLVDLQSGAERVLSELPRDFVIQDFDVAADGSEVVFDRVEENSELALIERHP